LGWDELFGIKNKLVASQILPKPQKMNNNTLYILIKMNIKTICFLYLLMDKTTNDILIKNKTEMKQSQETITYELMEDELFKKLVNHKSVHLVLKSFNAKNENSYKHDYHILAIDKNESGGKFYICFKHITDKVAFIESWKYGNLYEIIINDIVKPYYDIDYKVGKYKTDDEVKLIVNGLIKEFNSYYRLTTTSDNTYCYGKRCGETNLWKSIHIVIDKFKITKTAIKDLVDRINKSRSGFKKIVGALDGKVYTKNRLFSLPHQRKRGGNEFFEWVHIWSEDATKYSQTDITNKYLINDVKNCEFNNYFEDDEKYVEIVENKIIKQDIKQTRKKDGEAKALIMLNPQNLVDELLKHLPNEFYDDAMWNNISRQIILNKFIGYEKWLLESANKSINYTHEHNIKWRNKLNDKFISNNINKYLILINEHFGCCFIWSLFNYFNDDIYKWICAKSSTTKSELKIIVLRYTTEQEKKRTNVKTINIGNNYVYDMKKQVLTNELTREIFHYGLDTGFNTQYGIDTTKFKTISQDEIVGEMTDFLKSIHRLSGWKMLWGSGKTHYGVDTINKYAIESGKRVLFLTENNNLNIEMTAKFNGVNHLADKDELNNLASASLVITSMESLNKMLYKNDGTPFEIILFDEYESIIHHLLSTTTFISTKTTPYEVSVMIKNLINVADKIICLDCDLSETRMNLITNIFTENNDNEKPQLFNCSHNSWENYNYNIYRQNEKMKNDAMDDLFINNKRIIYATTAFADGSTIYEMMWRKSLRDNKTKNMLFISRDGVEYFVNDEIYNSRTMKAFKDELKLTDDNSKREQLKKHIAIGCYASKDKTKAFAKLEQVIIELNIDLFIYTPSVKCGISFGNSETEMLFDKLYGYATNGSIPAREFLQMLHRCRHLEDKQINFCVKNDLTSTSNLIHSDIIENLINKNQQLKFNDDKWWKDNVDIEKYAIDDFYKQITITNFKEMLDSERNYTQELLGKLKFNHNLNVNIINVFEADEDIISTKDDYDATKSHQANIRQKLFQYEANISQDEYDRLKLNTTNDDTYLSREKFKTIKMLRINNSTNKLLQDERLKDAEKQALINSLDIGKRYAHGIFQNYTTNKENKTFFYNENDENCDDIVKTDCDLNEFIQYSDWLLNAKFNINIGKISHIKHLYKLNNEIISSYVYDTERTQSDFNKYDIETNKLKITKSIMDIMGIDRIDLLYNRKIMTNADLKALLDKNKKFIINQLLYFINSLDTETIEKEKLDCKKYTSSNKIHYKYVKKYMLKFLASIGIQIRHMNRSGGVEKNDYENDNCLLVIQYENFNDCDLIKRRTFINTYYDTMKNDIYFHQFNTQRLLNETINKEILNKNIEKKTRNKQSDKKYHSYRNVVFKKNRHITYTLGENEFSMKIPFNLLTADFIHDKDENVIMLKNKTDTEKVAIYLKIETNNSDLIPTYKMSDIKTTKYDARIYEYKDVAWKQTDNNYYVKEQIDKYTTNKKAEDNIIIENYKTENDVVNDVLNDIIETIVFKDDFKDMVNKQIGLGGEQELIAKQIELLRDLDEPCLAQYPIMTSNDAHAWVHRPNILVK